MVLVVGQTATLSGDITQLKAFGAKAPSGVEDMLGYNRGRLAAGYWIALLLDALSPADFELAGNTLRSGGRLGLPGHTQADDDARVRVHDTIMVDYGANGYAALQSAALLSVTAVGDNRLAKVVPVTPHANGASPAFQYPMGGGSLQWRLKKPGKRFFIAAFVDAAGMAQTPTMRASVAANAPYEGRAALRRYLETAP